MISLPTSQDPGKLERPVRRAATGNGATARSEAPCIGESRRQQLTGSTYRHRAGRSTLPPLPQTTRGGPTARSGRAAVRRNPALRSETAVRARQPHRQPCGSDGSQGGSPGSVYAPNPTAPEPARRVVTVLGRARPVRGALRFQPFALISSSKMRPNTSARFRYLPGAHVRTLACRAASERPRPSVIASPRSRRQTRSAAESP